MPANEAALSLPAQVSPPEFALSAFGPHAIQGVEVLALPVLPADGDDKPSVLLGPGGDEVADLLGTDLLAVLEQHSATGKAGEVVSFPVPLGGAGNDALRWVLMVGLGEQRVDDFRRAGAATTDEPGVSRRHP